MLRFLSAQRIEDNVRSLCAQAGFRCEEPRRGYFSLLNRMQTVPIFAAEARPRALWQLERSELSPLERYFRHKLLDGEAPARLSDSEVPEHKLAVACTALGAFEPSALQAVSLLVGQVVMVRSTHGEGGASVPEALGTIWMRPGVGWSTELWSESVWHETTHQGLFLEELVSGLFTLDAEAMSRPEAMVVSAIWPYTNPRKSERPLYRAFHSACVASELSRLFRWQGRAEQARSFREGALDTLGQLQQRTQFLTLNGQRVLDDLAHELAA